MVLNRTTHHVQIQLGINWQQQGTWTSDQVFQTWIRTQKSAVYGHLDRKF